MNKLNGKKVLFIGSGFYFYDKSIAKEIENYGALVKYTIEFEVSNSLKLKRNLSGGAYEINAIAYRENELLDLYKEELFDYIFVIRAQYLSSDFYFNLKKIQKKSTFILYLWDSVSTTRDFFLKEKYFDKILSFDRHDTLKYPYINFRPLFYLSDFSDDFNINEDDEINDIYFLGRLYGDRISIIRKIKKECELKKLKSELILFAALGGDLLHSLRKYHIKKADLDFVTFKTLSLADNVSKMKRSISILDIELDYQSGLTMRTIESIGAKKKLITTNKDIVNYDFYDSTRIFVIDRKEPCIPVDFIRKPMNHYDRDIMEKYSLKGWVRDVFELQK